MTGTEDGRRALSGVQLAVTAAVVGTILLVGLMILSIALV